ncbi:hypothetical protein [Spirillospora sp. NPDC047279]|uniref:hypothetical protein n=1 Tax=Spirillospora sp. NPDC047279 TaxID=3155478 RepID=UPI0033DCFE21
MRQFAAVNATTVSASDLRSLPAPPSRVHANERKPLQLRESHDPRPAGPRLAPGRALLATT